MLVAVQGILINMQFPGPQIDASEVVSYADAPLYDPAVLRTVFIDFESGDVLQVAGRTALIFNGPQVAAFEGAQRLWTVNVEHLVRRPAALALKWLFIEFSPFSLAKGVG